MKKIFIAAAALLLTTAATQAQTKEATKDQHHKGIQARKPFGKLNLNDDQKKQAKEINESYSKQFAELKKNTSMPVGEYRTKTTALRKEQHEKIQALLTPEQKAQAATQRKQFGDRMKGGRDKGFGREGQAQRFEKMKTQLGLTEEQSKKLKDNQSGYQAKLKGIREDKTLTDVQKKEQAKAVIKQQREDMKSIFTPEQLQKMKAGRKNRVVESK